MIAMAIRWGWGFDLEGADLVFIPDAFAMLSQYTAKLCHRTFFTADKPSETALAIALARCKILDLLLSQETRSG
jgi:hypothetical protein